MRKKIIGLLLCTFLITTTIPLIGALNVRTATISSHSKLIDAKESSTEEDSEYWALLVAVGIYANNPDMDRPSMLVEVENLYNTLLVSDHWKEENLQVITARNATVPNILQGFSWLREKADENDRCLVYLTTHGFPILWDLPPFDEEDGMDEALAAYNGFLPFPNPWSWEPLANPFAVLTDDMINNNLNKVECEGMCVIVDSCHSGGFNDNWTSIRKTKQLVDFAEEFSLELQGQNRVIMTSVPEEDTSYGSYFSHFLAEGMQGYADANNDGLCSAEEAFWYAEEIIREETRMQPQIFDNYPGELTVTQVELPPENLSIDGEKIGKTNATNSYQLYAVDPENNELQYHIKWGDGNEEYTEFYASGTYINITHAWEHEGTYELALRAIDAEGAYSDWNYLTVTMADAHHEVDQRQVEYYYGSSINQSEWVAQSFVPSLSTLSKVELNLGVWQNEYSVNIMIKEGLDGNTICETSKTIEPTDDYGVEWISFNLDDVSVNPGKTYYMVCNSNTTEGWSVIWTNTGRRNDVYQNGTIYYSDDAGNSWDDSSGDATFVTYG